MTIPIEPVLDFMKQVVDRSGVKPVVAILFGYGIMQLTLADKVSGLIAVIAMTVICVALFYARHLEKINEVDNGRTP